MYFVVTLKERKHMLKNQEATSTTGTPPIDTSHELKWRRTLRKKLINCLVLIENHGKPTQELMFELRLAKDALRNWNSDTADWEKHSMVFPVKLQAQTELQKPEVDEIKLD